MAVKFNLGTVPVGRAVLCPPLYCQPPRSNSPCRFWSTVCRGWFVRK